MFWDKFKFPFKFARSFTLMFVPHSQQSIYRMRIPVLILKVSLVILVCAVLSISYFSVRYLNMQENMKELHALREVNDKQKTKLKSLETKTKEMQQKMSKLKSLEKDVREMLKDDSLSGRGGGNLPRSYYSRVNITENNANQNGLPSLFDSYQDEIEDWNNKYSKVQDTTVNLAGQIDEVKKELSTLKKDIADKKAYLAARPSGYPVAGRITSGYGSRRNPVTGSSEFHSAIDFAASYGVPVVATGKGRVIFAGYKSGYGYTVVIDHQYGFRTFYAHNSRLAVNVGDRVTRGEVIARVGSSGLSTGCHVHYEVHLHGVAQNPANYL
ncbi:MAG: peptidoglycan DD-metalloendopeptidase family protein [Clostridiales bacterium]|nr:peptidoglycan DD-metalloendopeptidase family protein [Clostridiales bacterium]MCF8023342.1 peptidoglycan DD-metalloendopeptidase family protein [Clostridiales bacterium]